MPASIRSAEVYAPGSVGNVGPGLDVLGLAVSGAGDTVHAERTETPGIIIADPGHPDLPRESTAHAASIAAHAVLERAGRLDVGMRLTVRKGLPLSGGQGGSAASAAAGAGAANALLGRPLTPHDLIAAALVAESQVAGHHADNIAPSILGGMVLVRSLDPLDLVPLHVPSALRIVLIRPDMTMRTADARRVLPTEVPREVAIHQSAQVAAIVAAILQNDLALLGRAIDDRLAEPARAGLLPGFLDAKRAALRTGALGVSISGSGPTAFALCDDDTTATQVAEAMRAAYRAQGLESDVRLTRPDPEGLRVILR